jgi:hypothetical protein
MQLTPARRAARHLALGLALLMPAAIHAQKVRIYSDRACAFFSGERTQSDARLAAHEVRSIKVESGGWFATEGEDGKGRRWPEDAARAYTAQNGCVAFDRQVGSLTDAQWLMYQECGAACRSYGCMGLRSGRDLPAALAYLLRRRDTGEIATRAQCSEQIEDTARDLRVAPDTARCACECLPLHHALPPNTGNRAWLRTRDDRCVNPNLLETGIGDEQR